MLKLGMGVFAAAAACVLAASGGSAFASVSGWDGSASDASITFGGNNADTVNSPHTYVTSLSGLSADFSQPGNAGFMRKNEGTGWGGNFGSGEQLLFTGDNSTGPITVEFNSDVQGVGAQIQPDFYGFFNATIEAFDFTGTSLGSFSITHADSTFAGNDSAVFLGILSNTANIRKVTFQTFRESTSAVTDFAINGPSIKTGSTTTTTAVPLPPAALMGLGVLGAGALKRLRRRNKSA